MREPQTTRATSEFGSAANRYEILAKLATGGMAEIFLARGLSATGVERHVVLKRILRQRATDVHFVKMFLDEARLAAQLQHANVAQVYDIGRLGDSYFFTMEYVHGETVRALLHRAHGLKRPLPVGSVLAIALGAASGLHHAHERVGVDGRSLGIVHRDVSPSNLMVSFDGGVKVVDFGVAKAADRMSETRSGTVKGKISYLSPEQCLGSPVDQRSDIFALGIVLWEMLATDRLYRRASDFENMTAIVHEPVQPPSSRRADIPPELDALVLKMMAKAPADRFQSGGDLIEAIETFAARNGIVLSATGLGRLLREMFGQRPEPWVEIQSAHMAEGGVTVTSEPIPAELELPVEESFEQQLGVLPDLSPAQLDDAISHSSPRAAKAAAAASASARFTAPTHTAKPPVDRERLQTEPMEVPPPTGPDRPSPVASAAAVATPRAVPQTPPRRRTLVAMIMLIAAVVGIAIGVVVMRWDRGDEPRDTNGSGAATPVVAAVTIDAAVARVDPPIDAAAIPVELPPVGSADGSDTGSASISASVPGSGSVSATRTPRTAPTLAQLYAANRWVELADRCAEHAPAGDFTIACAIAACKLHRDADARRYFTASTESRRARIVAACPALAPASAAATPPQQSPSAPDCKADPMACPH